MVVPENQRGVYERAIKSLWKDNATIYVRESYTDEETALEKQREISVLDDEPCRIVYVSSPTTGDDRGAPAKAQTIKLLIDRNAELPLGSKISVLREDTDEPEEYRNAGMAGIYSVHKEITLEVWKGWA